MQERHFATGIYLNPNKALNYLAYGEVYKSALKSLIAHFEKTDEDIQKEITNNVDSDILLLAKHDYGIAPLSFLFRHYIEIKLKGLILYKGNSFELTHDIDKLFNQLKDIIDSERFSDETCLIIEEFQILDKSSDGFRYPYTTKDAPSLQDKNDFLKYFNSLSTFKEMVDFVIDDLTNLEGDIDAEKEHWEDSMNSM
ncbi:MAG: HEPN domain-containing protein [Thaumarchaeota archaeon]|nr:HEPN domain-containing protein [Nitrososphaerota archaeon]